MPANPTAITAGAGSLWVASEEAGTVTRIEPRSGTVVRAITVGNGPSAIAAGEGAIWVVNRHDGTLSRIDPGTDAVSWTLPVGREPTAVSAGGGAVWVAGGEDATVTRVDPRRPRVLRTIQVKSPATAVAATAGQVWTATGAAAARHRGGTLRVRYSIPDARELPIDWLDPDGYFWLTWQATSLAYDGLVAYRRVGGVAGATLVGGLADEVPAPSRDGRTNVFRLRPGLRYSDDRPVQPEDFRASMERLLRVTGSGQFPPFFDAIAGAPACVRRPARCDLSAGITTDARARTIAIHLTRPDSELLHKLTLPFAYVVPSGTPDRPAAGRLPPGTGPYRFATWDPRRGGQLIRNARFQPGRRPAGFADRIEIALGDERAIETDIADIEAGRADLAHVADPLASLVGSERLPPIAARAPGQLHGAPAAATDYMYLNVRRPPFDDVRVRRALNDAVDRDRLVELVGGANVAAPNCQTVPVGFPGHEPYCPYGSGSAPGRGWTAPNVERARRRVAASGRAGTRVVVWVPGHSRAIGRYFVDVLNDLGFRAALRAFANSGAYFTAIFGGAEPQIGYNGWSADYLTASTFIQTNFGCAERPWNLSHLCDATLTRRIERALSAQGAEAAKRWAAADRRLVDLAAAVPLTSHRTLAFVSERVGNVQLHPQWVTLLDQLWVR